MLKIASVDVDSLHVAVFTISIGTSISSMAYTCVSDEKALIGDLFDIETCRPELLYRNSRAHCRAFVEES